MVHSLVQVAAVIGPIMGGAINTMQGMQQTCLIMGIVGAASLIVYLLFAIFVWCTVHHENDLPRNLGQEDQEEEEEDNLIMLDQD